MKLEWQIETDRHAGVGQQHREDPERRRRRNRQLRRVVLTVLAMLGVIVAALGFVRHRLAEADERIRRMLENTVRAEITALNLGEQATFAAIQRSATGDWLRAQAEMYLQYQADKVTTDRVLTGRILDVTVDGQRGRVQVEEIQNGTPYVRTWFYWNYDERRDAAGNVIETAGWHHVAPDFTFWGETRTLAHERFTVRYQSLDEPFAQAMSAAVTRWYETLCAAVDCTAIPYLTIDIVPDPAGRVAWQGEAWQLVIPSPYTGRARVDQPFSGVIAMQTAEALADRVVLQVSLPVTAELDAAFVVEAVQRWLVGRWMSIDNGSYLIESAAQQFGVASISRVLGEVRSNSAISLLSRALNADLGAAALDWRDFLTFRLGVEAAAAQRGDLQTLARLYAPTPEGQQRAAARIGTAVGSPVVVSVTRETSPDGLPQLFAVTADGATAVFRLYDQVWMRAQ